MSSKAKNGVGVGMGSDKLWSESRSQRTRSADMQGQEKVGGCLSSSTESQLGLLPCVLLSPTGDWLGFPSLVKEGPLPSSAS